MPRAISCARTAPKTSGKRQKKRLRHEDGALISGKALICQFTAAPWEEETGGRGTGFVGGGDVPCSSVGSEGPREEEKARRSIDTGNMPSPSLADNAYHRIAAMQLGMGEEVISFCADAEKRNGPAGRRAGPWMMGRTPRSSV